MTNVKATVAYTGGGFHGFAANDGVRTVAGEIEAALAKIIGEHIPITCAGRTDKGVHGRGQVISLGFSSARTTSLRSVAGRLRPRANRRSRWCAMC